MSTTPRNTSAADPLDHMIGMLGGTSAYIEGQERQGQRELVTSDVLPSRVNGCSRSDLTALGFVFGEPVQGDDLFVHADLPTGWKREGSDHAMWSHIVDERGIKRVSVFYKAAFYDRDAFLGLVNVGGQWSSEIEYSDEPVAFVIGTVPWGLLTTQERADLLASLQKRIDHNVEYEAYQEGDRLRERQACTERLREALRHFEKLTAEVSA